MINRYEGRATKQEIQDGIRGQVALCVTFMCGHPGCGASFNSYFIGVPGWGDSAFSTPNVLLGWTVDDPAYGGEKLGLMDARVRCPEHPL